jgi:hypothetical protein
MNSAKLLSLALAVLSIPWSAGLVLAQGTRARSGHCRRQIGVRMTDTDRQGIEQRAACSTAGAGFMLGFRGDFTPAEHYTGLYNLFILLYAQYASTARALPQIRGPTHTAPNHSRDR